MFTASSDSLMSDMVMHQNFRGAGQSSGVEVWRIEVSTSCHVFFVLNLILYILFHVYNF